MRDVKIELTQARSASPGTKPNYRVDKMINTTEFKIGTWIKEGEVDDLIKNGWTVVVTGERDCWKR